MARLPASERIARVVERWFLVEPLLFAVWTTHRLEVEPRIYSLRVGYGRIEYNPAFVDALDERELRAVLGAEALRILLKHPYSRRRPDPRLAYLASNITLAEVHPDPLLPFPTAMQVFGTPELDQRYFELYYNRLVEKGSGGMAGSASQNGCLQQYADGWEESTALWEEDDLLAGRIDDHIRDAAQSNSWGTIAGRLREHILATLSPHLDYRAVLRHFRASVLSSTRLLTRMKPSRRYGFSNPGNRRQLSTRLLVAVDVSGSMSREDIAVGFSIVNRFFRYGIESIDVLQFDAEIQGSLLSLRQARKEVVIRGRGGTCFQPVIHWLDEHPGYDGLIVFTDGCAPAPPRPKSCHTRILWLFTNQTTWATMYGALRDLGPAAYVKG